MATTTPDQHGAPLVDPARTILISAEIPRVPGSLGVSSNYPLSKPRDAGWGSMFAPHPYVQPAVV
jgi:hypothetical protein